MISGENLFKKRTRFIELVGLGTYILELDTGYWMLDTRCSILDTGLLFIKTQRPLQETLLKKSKPIEHIELIKPFEQISLTKQLA